MRRDRGPEALQSKVAVVTGAAGGIGRALAAELGAAGCRVALLDLHAEPLEQLAAELAATGTEALPLPCDVTSPDACGAAMESVTDAWGGVDVLVNNAGITHVSLLADTSAAVYRRVMDVNFFGALYCTQAALPSLAARRGRIVVTSSVAGFAPLATRTGYAASKHALDGLFDSLRAEVRPAGVSVTIVCPSFVRTGIGDSALGGDGGRPSMQRTQTGTPVEPAELARAVVAAATRRRRLLLYPRSAWLPYVMWHALPPLYERMMAKRIMTIAPAKEPGRSGGVP